MAVGDFLTPVSVVTPLGSQGQGSGVDKNPKLSQAGIKFEAYFLEKMLESGNQSMVSKDGYLGDDSSSDVLLQMQNKAFADELSKNGGFGIAQMITDLENM